MFRAPATPPDPPAAPPGSLALPAGDPVRFQPSDRIASVTNDWGVGFWDDQGSHTGHKQYARQH